MLHDTWLTRIRRIAFASLVVLAATALTAPAFAHADLESTSPADRDVMVVPVERVELVFTDTVQITGSGARLLDGNGREVPASVFSASETTIAIIPDDPLANGRYAVVWQVESADGHEIPGSISFEVALPVASGSQDDGADEAASSDTTVTTAASTPTTVVITHTPAQVAQNPTTVTSPADATDPALMRLIGFVGRWATLLGALLAIGAFAFGATAMVGSRREVQRSVQWVQRGAALLLLGTVAEVTSVLIADLAAGMALVEASVDLLSSSFGVTVVLRLAGGTAMLMDPHLVAMSPVDPVIADESSPEVDDPREPQDGVRVATRMMPVAEPVFRLDAGREWVAIAGMTAIAVSFMFDGHTVTAEPDLVARISALVHVVAGAVWLGGLVVLGDILIRRRHGSVPLDAARIGLRFSRVATGAIVAVGAAGLALAWTIMDGPGDLVSTSWGRLLLVKVALVAVAGAIGGYNHFFVVPRIARAPEDAQASSRLRRTVAIEAGVLVAAVVVTAALVVAPI